MAKKRMFSLDVIDTDVFIEMSAMSRLLYYELSMRADDDGFIGSPKKIQKMVGCSDDDMRLLIHRKFIIPFETGVIVIRHWKMNNYLRSDRIVATIYQEEKKQLIEKPNGIYESAKCTDLSTKCQPTGIPSIDLVLDLDLDKISIDKNSIEIPLCNKSHEQEKWFYDFWFSYPRKVNKKKAEASFKKVVKNEDTFFKIMVALDKQKKSIAWTKDNGDFIPHPTTWINGERWNDEVEEKKDRWEERTVINFD